MAALVLSGVKPSGSHLQPYAPGKFTAEDEGKPSALHMDVSSRVDMS